MNIYITGDLYSYSELNWFVDYYDSVNNTMFENIDILTPEGCRFMAKPRREWVESWNHWNFDDGRDVYSPHYMHSPTRLAMSLFYHGYMRLFQMHTCNLPEGLAIDYYYESFLDNCPYLKPEIRTLVMSRMRADNHIGFGVIYRIMRNALEKRPLHSY